MDRAQQVQDHGETEALAAALLAAAEEAASLALAAKAAGLSLSHKGADLGQALTGADLAVGAMLRSRFGPRLIEEESAEGLDRDVVGRLLAEDAWTIVADPVDGTKPYAGGLSSWGILLAACRRGWPRIGVIALPEWGAPRGPAAASAVGPQGLVLAAWDGCAYAAPTRAGQLVGDLAPLVRPEAPTHHVGWLPVAAQRYTLDYAQGLFPWSESAFAADAALLALGRLDATVFDHKLWDFAGAWPILEALGFRLHHWPDLAPPPGAMIELFDADLTCHDDLWLLCRDEATAGRLGRAIRRVGR